jgi:Uma2 family endonuclease
MADLTLDNLRGATTAAPAWVARRPLTVADYHHMAEAGIFGPHERVELLNGELMAMAPIGSGHAGVVNRTARLLVRLIGDRGIVAVQNPVRLNDLTEPQPDFAILKPRPDDYEDMTPRPRDVIWLIEIADSSLRYDQEIKRRAYASGGIAELWIVDLASRHVEVFRDPRDGDYSVTERVGRDGILAPSGLLGVAVPVSAVLR